MIKKNIRLKQWAQFLLHFVLFYLVLIIIYGPKLMQYVLSGDDVFNVSYTITTLDQAIHQFTLFSAGYRPFGFIFFNLYRSLVPHMTLIFFINLGFVALSQTLLFFLLKKITPGWIAASLSLVIYLSPIMFYPIFAISGSNNTVMVIIFLSVCHMAGIKNQTAHNKKIISAYLLFIFSIFVKETFIVLLPILFLIAYQNTKKHTFYKIVLSILAITGTYIALRLKLFVVTDDNYRFVVTPAKLIENTKLMIAWILNYPRGWQYGAPLPKNILTYLVSGITAACYAIPLFLTIKSKNTKSLFFVGLFILAVAPYLFLNRILVYYMDIVLILCILFCAYAISHLDKRLQYIYVVVFLSTAVLHFLVIYPQWHTYSFVANANETAHNYLNTLKKAHAENYSSICILNHNKGNWATKNGELANMVYDNKFKINAYPDSADPKKCDKKSLILRNDERKYKLVSK